MTGWTSSRAAITSAPTRWTTPPATGLLRAIDDGERSGAINSVEAFVLRLAAQAAPIDKLIEYVREGLG